MAGKSARVIHFTKATIEALTVGPSRVYYHDAKVSGLTVCVAQTGRRTFYLVKRIAGRSDKVRIGEFPGVTIEQARKAAEKLNGSIASGANPGDERRQRAGAWTLKEAFDEYMQAPSRTRAKRPRSPVTLAGYRYLFDKFLPTWADRRLSDIDRVDVERFCNQLAESSGPYLSNRVLSLLKAVCNLAVDRGGLTASPIHKLSGFEELERERRLMPDEIERFFAAVDAEPSTKIQDFVRLALFTGARRGNLLSMRWADVNFERGVWSIPRTKSGRPLDVPLSQAALDILRRRFKTRGDSPFVFPGRHAGHLTSPDREWRSIVKRAGLDGLRIHDLRRTFGSWLADTNASLPTIGKSLGHARPESTAIYARLSLDPVRASAEKATQAILAAGKRKRGAK